MVTFIHAADLHLDSPLRGLPDYDGAPLDEIRSASRRAFSALIDVALQRHVDFVVLAGDVWDGDWPDIGTGLFFVQETARLGKEGIPVFLLRGNHDAESRLTKSITFPEWIRIFDHEKPESFVLKDLGVALHGQSFARPDVADNIALGYPDAQTGCINIGVLHTALDGYTQHRPYAPCTLGELRGKKYDYWALGHVHEHEILATGRADDGGTIAFPGVLQGRQVRETGPKGALHVEIDENGVRIERLILDVVRWHDFEVDIGGFEDIKDVAHAMGTVLREMIEAAKTTGPDCLNAVRLTLRGATTLHGRLRLEHQSIRDEAIAQAAAVAAMRIYIEKVRFDTTPPKLLDAGDAHDALAYIQGFMGEAADDPQLVKDIGEGLQAFFAGLPADARTALAELRPDVFAAAESGSIDALLPGGTAAVVNYLARR